MKPEPIPHPCPHPDCEGTIQVVADPGETFEHWCPCKAIRLIIERKINGEVTVTRKEPQPC